VSSARPVSGDATPLSGRYDRQVLLPEVGPAGQDRLEESVVLVVGCGALGCGVADLLARAGVGTLRIADRDVVECTNLQRQVLYSESDIGRPKAVAAADRLRAVNSSITIEASATDVNASNIASLASGADILIDGLDNFDARYLVNDLAVRDGLPYIYAGAVGTEGLVMPLLPRDGGEGRVSWSEDESTPCLRCLFPEPPPPGAAPTCDTAGVLGPAIAAVTAHQAALAMALLLQRLDLADRTMHSVTPWSGPDRRMNPGRPRADCPCCGNRRFEWLEEGRGGRAEVMCGRDTTQVHPATPGAIDLRRIADNWTRIGEVHGDEHAIRIDLPDEKVRITLFADGRALITVDDATRARTLYDRYVGD